MLTTVYPVAGEFCQAAGVWMKGEGPGVAISATTGDESSPQRDVCHSVDPVDTAQRLQWLQPLCERHSVTLQH